jgi:hypothetical protein
MKERAKKPKNEKTKTNNFKPKLIPITTLTQLTLIILIVKLKKKLLILNKTLQIIHTIIVIYIKLNL